ncbi:MAG: dTDP-glucose 4,6-dehydratase [Gammaproteobacteria bacterium]|nr:MAG: dTDP-glucose 4,6-dehydratase [Gammaproteobacteria bacterium]
MKSQRRRLLVTGGAGFIGANFVHYWRHHHPTDELVVLDALTYAGNRMNLADLESAQGLEFIHGDIVDQPLAERLIREREIDTVAHFAAESHVDRSIVGPDQFITTNVLGTHSLLKACRKVWIEEKKQHGHRFHHISTDEVYGSLEPDQPAFTEDSPYAPNSPYSASKAASDHLVRAYFHTYGLQVTTTNCSNNYGPYHFPEKLIPLMIVNALHGKPLPVYGDGRNVRDWLYVTDHCAAIDLVLSAGTPGTTYNVGGDCERDNLTLIGLLCDLLDDAFVRRRDLCRRFRDAPAACGGKSADLIAFVKDRPGHDRRYAIDSSLIRDELGFVPKVDLERGLRSTIEWYLANEAWWRAVMSGAYRDWVARNYAAR